ncbi:AGCS family alanine or glycine:cation symporter [Deinobacterium chartae]|uniref:AGCS family alanine or glycine:cation symporter n=1 Tax=Deinobacterium chartae TaxID=521158 RepID=A0A841I0F6_9DEIO|nr:amino acid carrier protein [Deinobacterium chartae]MBB6097465.1 AGCS family alanine or glycine:cation symporter [Deinobacterium chartae]
MQDFLSLLNGIFFGLYAMALFVVAGGILTVRTGFLQFRRFRVIMSETIGSIRERNLVRGSGQITPFQATMVALSGTVGAGNITGVATALLIGGPGAIFWMWVIALLGMATKFAEATLAVHFRQLFNDGSVSGGPMYYLSRGLKLPWMGTLWAALTLGAAFGIGNLTQISTFSETLVSAFNIPTALIGMGAALLVLVTIGGGIVRIARFSQVAFPLMLVIYAVTTLGVIIANITHLPSALASIFGGAFGLAQVGGGVAGYAIMQVLKAGLGRGIFSNEAGFGSSAVAHAQAQVDHPVRQGFWGAFEVFLDTFVINTLTALAVLSVPDILQTTGGTAAQLMVDAVTSVGGLSGVWSALLALSIALFTLTTAMTWAFYAEEACIYLFGDGSRWPFRLLWAAVIFLAPLTTLDQVVLVSDTLNGMMALPNLIGLLALAPLLARLVASFFNGDEYRPSDFDDFEPWWNRRKRGAVPAAASNATGSVPFDDLP